MILSRSHWLFFPSFLLFSIFSPSIISQANYPPEYVENYIRECTGDRGLVVESVCRCVIKTVQEEFIFEEFEEINQEIETTGEFDSRLLEIIDSCQTDPFS